MVEGQKERERGREGEGEREDRIRCGGNAKMLKWEIPKRKNKIYGRQDFAKVHRGPMNTSV